VFKCLICGDYFASAIAPHTQAYYAVLAKFPLRSPPASAAYSVLAQEAGRRGRSLNQSMHKSGVSLKRGAVAVARRVDHWRSPF
jgi:hypothetical protein